MKFGLNIFITFSKAMALLVLIIGSTFAFLYNSAEVIIFSLSLAGAYEYITDDTNYFIVSGNVRFLTY